MANEKSNGVRWIAGFLIFGLIGLAVWRYTHDDKTPPDFQSAVVVRGDLLQSVTATGTLNPVTNITVGSQISGIILNLYADWNSRVKANQIVAQLDPGAYQAAVAQAEGDLANSKASLELSEIEARRADELFKNKLIAESDHDTAIANLHQAQAMVKIKEAALTNAQVNLSRCTIVSPVDGIVISRNVDVGQTVAASLSAPTLFIIANDLAQMQIDANVAEADVGGIEEGQGVNFTVDAFPYRTFRGKVVQVRNSPTTLQNVVTYDTVISVNNADLKLKPGMTANVSIIIAERTNTIKIPNAALRFRPPEVAGVSGPTNSSARVADIHSNGPAPTRPHVEKTQRIVYILPPEINSTNAPNVVVKPQPVQVRTGITDGIATEILDGLNEGDRVIIGLAQPAGNSGAPANNPFGGGFQRR
jgi:HlyD family secretion protein